MVPPKQELVSRLMEEKKANICFVVSCVEGGGEEGACNFSDCNTLLDIISIRHSEHGTLLCSYDIN